MKKYFKNIILSLILLGNIIPFFSFGIGNIKLLLPDGTWQEDINIESIQVQTNETTVFSYIKIINKYLWFIIAGVAMAVLIYAGIMMITASGDKAKFSKAGKLALSCVVAILVAILSYNLVNLIVNLF